MNGLGSGWAGLGLGWARAGLGSNGLGSSGLCSHDDSAMAPQWLGNSVMAPPRWLLRNGSSAMAPPRWLRNGWETNRRETDYRKTDGRKADRLRNGSSMAPRWLTMAPHVICATGRRASKLTTGGLTAGTLTAGSAGTCRWVDGRLTDRWMNGGGWTPIGRIPEHWWGMCRVRRFGCEGFKRGGIVRSTLG